MSVVALDHPVSPNIINTEIRSTSFAMGGEGGLSEGLTTSPCEILRVSKREENPRNCEGYVQQAGARYGAVTP